MVTLVWEEAWQAEGHRVEQNHLVRMQATGTRFGPCAQGRPWERLVKLRLLPRACEQLQKMKGKTELGLGNLGVTRKDQGIWVYLHPGQLPLRGPRKVMNGRRAYQFLLLP